MRVRILSYNIHRAIGVDRRFRLDRIGAILEHHDADVVLLQEVDQGVPRSRRLDLARELASALDYPYVAVGHNVQLRTGRYGNATLSRHPIRKHRNIDLTRRQAAQPGLPAHSPGGDGTARCATPAGRIQPPSGPFGAGAPPPGRAPFPGPGARGVGAPDTLRDRGRFQRLAVPAQPGPHGRPRVPLGNPIRASRPAVRDLPLLLSPGRPRPHLLSWADEIGWFATEPTSLRQGGERPSPGRGRLRADVRARAATSPQSGARSAACGRHTSDPDPEPRDPQERPVQPRPIGVERE